MQEQAGPYSAVRAEALALADRSNLLARAMVGPQPLGIMAQLATALPERGVLLQQLQIEPGRVRVVLTLSPEVPRAVLVRQIQAGGYFTSVREGSDVLPGGAVAFELGLATKPQDSGAPAASQPASGAASRGTGP